MLIFLALLYSFLQIFLTFVLALAKNSLTIMGIALMNETKRRVRMKNGRNELIAIIPDGARPGMVLAYNLYIAYGEGGTYRQAADQNPDFMGRILVDLNHNWIYDDDCFTIEEQEQIGEYIINHKIRDVL